MVGDRACVFSSLISHLVSRVRPGCLVVYRTIQYLFFIYFRRSMQLILPPLHLICEVPANEMSASMACATSTNHDEVAHPMGLGKFIAHGGDN